MEYEVSHICRHLAQCWVTAVTRCRLEIGLVFGASLLFVHLQENKFQVQPEMLLQELGERHASEAWIAAADDN